MMKNTNKNNIIVLGGGFIICILLLVIYFVFYPHIPEKIPEGIQDLETTALPQTPSEETAAPKGPPAILSIEGQKIEGEIVATDTIYTFMDKLRDKGKIMFTEKTYVGMGKIITSINGKKSSGSRTWIYYVNGVEAKVGVSNYQLKSGDVVSWEYEEVE